jgi:hypothetical protein
MIMNDSLIYLSETSSSWPWIVAVRESVRAKKVYVYQKILRGVHVIAHTKAKIQTKVEAY